MTQTETTAALTESDFDRLEELLDAPAFKGEAMRLDEIQAMLCAVVSSPEPVLPSVWLAEALGEAPEYESEAQAMETIDLLMRLNDSIAADLQADETVAPILYPLDENGEQYDYASWADAYVYGCGLGTDWFELAGKHSEDLSELLEPLFILNGMMKEDVENAGEKWLTPAEEAKLIADIEEDLAGIVQALYNFWKAKRSSVTVRREDNKVGRNDPCPCGSGKKFKQCCGRPDRLH